MSEAKCLCVFKSDGTVDRSLRCPTHGVKVLDGEKIAVPTPPKAPPPAPVLIQVARGWECPKCFSIVNPHIWRCQQCVPK